MWHCGLCSSSIYPKPWHRTFFNTSDLFLGFIPRGSIIRRKDRADVRKINSASGGSG
jgi:hypothetical protein